MKTAAASRSRPSAKGATRRAAQAAAPAHKLGLGWLNRLLILAGTGVVLAAGMQAYITLQAIPVKQITVTGKLQHTQTQAVQDMIQPALVGGFLSADLDRVREQLQALPWIYEVSVRRRWPHTLEVHVVEQLPIARWGEQGFLNHEGEVFESSSSSNWQSLPLLLGPEGTARSLMAKYQRLEQLLEPVELQVQELAVDSRGQIQVTLTNGIAVVLGNDRFLERVQRFVALYHSNLGQRAGEVARVDLRYQQGVAVAYREPPLVAGLGDN